MKIYIQERDKRDGIFIATTESGELLCESRTPIFDAARALSGIGVDDAEKLDTYRRGCVLGPDSTTTIGLAKKRTVVDTGARRGACFQLYREFPFKGGRDE